jgi:uncharacterized protein YcgL (UPF0745 family)
MKYSPRIFGRRYKKSARKLSYKRRHLRLTSNEQVRARQMKRFMFLMMAILSHESTLSDEDKEKCEEALKFTFMYYLNMVTYDDEPTEKCPNRMRTVGSFSLCECKIFFQFRRGDLIFLSQEYCNSEQRY